ncbi:Probable L-type lectin-domain containing receptor kinase VII.2 [Linum grandiflorum]
MSLILLLLLHSFFFFFFTPSSSVDFIFNSDFNSTNILTFGNATVTQSAAAAILTITDAVPFSLGRAFYPSPLPTTIEQEGINNSSSIRPFHTSFIFSIVPPARPLLPGHGFAFLFSPVAGIRGAISSQHMGLFNLSNDGSPANRVFAVEFDVFMNQEFNDLNDNHVGVDVNSLTSVVQRRAGVWSSDDEDGEFEELRLNNGENYQVWIDYVGSRINVTMAKAGNIRPSRALISEVLNLSGVFTGEMFVGFAAATGQLVESHHILGWSFSNDNASIGDPLITRNLPSLVRPDEESFVGSKGFVAVVIVGGLILLLILVMIVVIVLRKGSKKEEDGEEMEDWEMEYWPHRIDYQVIHEATSGFKEENVIGIGGNGKVYKGRLDGGRTEVAVKRISIQNQHGTREFLAELSSLGRLKHRNLVGIKGWCKKEKGSLILVYEYMENGSLDRKLFQPASMENGSLESKLSSVLSWQDRVRILKDVATGILYLHQGWEVTVLHRDIKASNVLLDKEMNARLGDFGLAKMHERGLLATTTTRVVGTVGYMAPEMVTTGRASTQTDVFSFGVLMLEVICGRRPVEQGKPSLVDQVRKLMDKGDVISAVDSRLKAKGDYGDEEVERMLQLGLLCTYGDPKVRPTMRQVVKAMEIEGQLDDALQANLLDRAARNNGMWSGYYHHHRGFNGAEHLTFDHVLQSLPSSVSLLGSDAMAEGR